MASITVTLSPTEIDLGDEVDFTISVYNDAAALAASTVALTITLPDGTTSSPTLSTSVTGIYTGSYTPTMVGRHSFDVNSTVTVVASYEDAFLVSQFYGLVSLDDARTHLNLSATTDDEELRAFIYRATDLLEAYLGRSLVRRTWTDEEHCGGGYVVELKHKPVLSVTSAYEDGTALSATGYKIDTVTGLLYRRDSTYTATAWASGLFNVKVTYVSGYTEPPPRAVQGCLELVRHLWDTQRVDRGAGRRPAGNDEYQPGLTYSMPRRVAELVDDLRSPGYI